MHEPGLMSGAGARHAECAEERFLDRHRAAAVHDRANVQALLAARCGMETERYGALVRPPALQSRCELGTETIASWISSPTV